LVAEQLPFVNFWQSLPVRLYRAVTAASVPSVTRERERERESSLLPHM